MIIKLDGLYKNWQAEYKEAMTSEQCEDIQRFYEPHVQKYETKYKLLCQMLKEVIGEEKELHHPEFLMKEKELHHPEVQHQS